MTSLHLSLKSKEVFFSWEPLVECFALISRLGECLLKLDKKKKRNPRGREFSEQLVAQNIIYSNRYDNSNDSNSHGQN